MQAAALIPDAAIGPCNINLQVLKSASKTQPNHSEPHDGHVGSVQ
jgi:hypothetical protein